MLEGTEIYKVLSSWPSEENRFFAGVYDWPPFIIAPGFSAIGILLMAALENVTRVQFLGQHTLEEIAAEGVPSEKEAMVAPMEALPHRHEKVAYEDKDAGINRL